MFSEVKDSGTRQSFGTGAVRDTQEGKGRYDLLPAYALDRIARHFENGAKKYGDENWRKGIPLRRYLDSGIRHAFKFLEGHRDEDHAAAAAWNFLALIETEEQIRRGNLPTNLNDLPDWTPLPPPVDLDECGTIDGTTPIPDDVADYMLVYQSSENPYWYYRLNGDVPQARRKEGGEWEDLAWAMAGSEFHEWLADGILTPVKGIPLPAPPPSVLSQWYQWIVQN